MRKLNVVCPLCSKFKRITIPSYIFNIDEGCLLKLPISENTICSHKFIAILDYNFNIRDYETNISDEDFSIYQNKIKMREISFTFYSI